MDKTFERVLNLFGKPDNDGLFAQFIDDLGEQPVILLQTDRVTEYDFGKSGLHLSYQANSLRDLGSEGSGFAFAIFSLGIDSKAFSSRRSYVGNLPNGIRAGDSPVEVARKLGIPADLKDDMILFELSNYKLSFSFFGDPLALSSLQVIYDPKPQ